MTGCQWKSLPFCKVVEALFDMSGSEKKVIFFLIKKVILIKCQMIEVWISFQDKKVFRFLSSCTTVEGFIFKSMEYCWELYGALLYENAWVWFKSLCWVWKVHAFYIFTVLYFYFFQFIRGLQFEKLFYTMFCNLLFQRSFEINWNWCFH